MGSALRATSMLLGFNTDTSAGVELNSCRFAARLGTLWTAVSYRHLVSWCRPNGSSII